MLFHYALTNIDNGSVLYSSLREGGYPTEGEAYIAGKSFRDDEVLHPEQYDIITFSGNMTIEEVRDTATHLAYTM